MGVPLVYLTCYSQFFGQCIQGTKMSSGKNILVVRPKNLTKSIMIECLLVYVLIDMLDDMYLSILTRMTKLLANMPTNLACLL